MLLCLDLHGSIALSMTFERFNKAQTPLKTKAISTDSFQVRQGVGEKLFVGGAFVEVDTLALAAVAAHMIEIALLAFVLDLHTFFYEFGCNGVL